MENNFYLFLNLSPDSPEEEIKLAINSRIRKAQAEVNNPNPVISKRAQSEIQELFEIRKILLTPAERKKYNEKLKTSQTINTIKKIPEKKETVIHSIALLIDTSWSMDGKKIEDAKEAQISFLDTINIHDNEVGLLTFGNTVECIEPLTRDREKLIKRIKTIKANGSTPLMEAFVKTDSEIMKHKKGSAVIVVATDGSPTDADEEKIVTYCEQLKSNGTRIITIGIGDDVNAGFLQKLATGKDDYHYAQASFELKNIYRNVVAGLSVYKKKQG
ncbi:MAG: VWA domain-containing protein [Spirochaetales bacterium]|nr:VWA domain-containing protein [Spirochaetales bacterium]